MIQNDEDIVTELLAATDSRDWPRVFELIGDRAISRDSSGRIYVGRAGFEDWIRDTAATSTARYFETAKVRGLGGGYVLVVGVEHRDPIRGLEEAIPGAWIYLVSNGLVEASMYFRTEREAIASITGPGRREPIVNVLERCADAFNRDDYEGIVALLDESIRFRPILIDEGITEEGLAAFTDALVTLRVRYDDVLVERVEVDEIGDGYAIATTTIRAVDDTEVIRRNLAHAVRVVDGLIAEWLPFERLESARLAVAAHLSAG
jgi:hypothetical protein